MNVTHQSQKSTVSQKPPIKTPSVTSKLPPSKPGTIIQGENPNIEEGEDPLQNVPQSQKIPNIRGEKTLVCWNCLTVLMVKDEWSVVRCTNCDKINRVPGTEDNIDSMIRLNDNMNHFDLYVPYVYAIVTCPFCQSENKVRKDAEHVVCFQCHNSYNILSDNKWVKPPQDPNTQYPDPSMFQPPKVEKDHSCQETQRLLKKLIKQLGKPKPQIVPPRDKYTVLRQLVRDVDEIDDRRFGKGEAMFMRRGMPGMGPPMKGIPNGGIVPRDSEAKNNIIDITNNKYLNDGMGTGGGDSEMEALKKKLYAEIKNDPKYRKKYGQGNMNTMPRRVMGTKPEYYDTPNDDVLNQTGNPKSEAVYKMMFTPPMRKDSNYKNMKKTGSSTDVDKLAKIYGGLEFNF